MYAERKTVTITTNGSGVATGYIEGLVGRLQTIRYVPDGTKPYAATVDVTITVDQTGQAILAVSDVSGAFTYAPRQPTHTTAGAAALFAGSGTAVNDHIVLAAGDRIKIVLAQGGDATVGAFHAVVS